MEPPECAPFEIVVRMDDDAVVLDVSGEFDLGEVDTFWSCLQDVNATTGTLVVDLGDVTFIDSSAIAALLKARRSLAEQDRELRLQHTAPVRRIFELAGLADLLESTRDSV
jgi:anti-anti-sigma factor